MATFKQVLKAECRNRFRAIEIKEVTYGITTFGHVPWPKPAGI